MTRSSRLASRALVLLAAGAGAFHVVACGAASKPPSVIDVAQPTPPPTSSAPATDPARPQPKQIAGGDADPATHASGGTRRVQGQGYHYEIPIDWEDLDATQLGSALIRHAQRSPRPRGGFAQNVNIAAEPYVGDGPSYGSANAVELVRVSTIRRQGSTHVGQRTGWDIEASWPNQGGVPYVTLQRYATDGATGFVITCSTGESVFSDERAACDAILDTFRVE